MEKLKNIKCLVALNVIFIVICIISCCVIINNNTKKNDCPKCENSNSTIVENCNTNIEKHSVSDEKKEEPEIHPTTLYKCLEDDSNDNECIVFNDEDLKVKIKDEPSETSYGFTQYLYINEKSYNLNQIEQIKKEDLGDYTNVYDINKLWDNYFYVILDSEPGLSIVLIFNYDGEIVTNINNMKTRQIRGASYDEGYFYTYEKNLPDNEQLCRQFGENDIIAVSRIFKYLGNGKVDDGTIFMKHTTLDIIRKMNVYSCEQWLNRR